MIIRYAANQRVPYNCNLHDARSVTMFILQATSGLYSKSFTVVIYYRNDSGQY
jgi:hypothetical protein